MAQKHEKPKSKSADAEQMSEEQLAAAPHAGETAVKKAELDEDIDSILDEIDDVLETNAEEFVKSYIQKGGE